MKNKFIVFFFIIILLTGCSRQELENNRNNENEKINIVCTIFPETDWVSEILGNNINNFEITTLLDSSVDLHNYQPRASDILKISNCDMFVYVGGESDDWVEAVLNSANNQDMVVVNLFEILGETVKFEEVVEGMEEEALEDEVAEESVLEACELDEHIWLSLRNAEFVCEYLTKEISLLDPNNTEVYQSNFESYAEELKSLDEEFKAVVETSTFDTLVFGDRFPFRYLVDDYNLNYYAAFTGCSAETEASFETIVFLADKVTELGINAVCTIEGTSHKIAETVVISTETKDQEVLVFNSMQSVTQSDIKDGTTYLSIMKENLNVLTQALN